MKRPIRLGKQADKAAIRPPVLRARLALAWEGCFALFLPALGWGCACLTVFFTGWLLTLPIWLHQALLVCFFIIFGWLLQRAVRHCYWPTGEAALRRIEQASGLIHRPFAALQDRLADGSDAIASALWQVHLERVVAQIGPLRAGWPRLGLVAHDPFGLRAPLLLCLLLSLFSAREAALDRLQRSLWPFEPAFTAKSVDGWITPPAYTGFAPLYLSERLLDAPLQTPVGSIVTLQIAGDRATPFLRQGNERIAFTKLDERHFRLEHSLTAGNDLSVEVKGQTVARWPLVIVPDRPPEVTISAPQIDRSQHLRFGFRATDDYGIDTAIAILRRVAADDALTAEPIDLLSKHLIGRRLLENGPYHDLTGHIWAGLPVQARIQVQDALGQHSESVWIDITLPERPFRHPVARALIALRKRLILSPSQSGQHRADLLQIARQPQLYGHNAGLFLALTVAGLRLTEPPTPAKTDDLQKLLWTLALALEEGELGARNAEMRAAEQVLRDALFDKASPQRIRQAIQEMLLALDRYQHALGVGQAQELAREIRIEDLRRLLETVGDLAEMGRIEQAQALLDRFHEIASALFAPGSQRKAEILHEALQNLASLSRRQQALMTQDSPIESQNELLRQLGDVVQRLDKNGLSLAELFQAEQAMRQASQALVQGARNAAESAQSRAAAHILDAARRLIAGQQSVQPDAMGQSDPLGRPSSHGSVRDGELFLPDRAELRRTRDIFEQLRKRTENPNLPTIERDYLDRLLRPF